MFRFLFGLYIKLGLVFRYDMQNAILLKIGDAKSHTINRSNFDSLKTE